MYSRMSSVSCRVVGIMSGRRYLFDFAVKCGGAGVRVETRHDRSDRPSAITVSPHTGARRLGAREDLPPKSHAATRLVVL